MPKIGHKGITENMMLLGLRKLLGKDCVDYPRKRILYHDFSDVPRNSLHGRGFSLYHEPMQDIPDSARDLTGQRFDVILYGTVLANGMVRLPELEKKCRFKFFIDGNDLYGVAQNNIYVYHDGERLIGNQQIPSFKGQIITENPLVFPTGVGLPESRILPIDLGRRPSYSRGPVQPMHYSAMRTSLTGDITSFIVRMSTTRIWPNHGSGSPVKEVGGML